MTSKSNELHNSTFSFPCTYSTRIYYHTHAGVLASSKKIPLPSSLSLQTFQILTTLCLFYMYNFVNIRQFSKDVIGCINIRYTKGLSITQVVMVTPPCVTHAAIYTHIVKCKLKWDFLPKLTEILIIRKKPDTYANIIYCKNVS